MSNLDIQIYQLKLRLKDINPMIWHRFLIQSNNTSQRSTLRYSDTDGLDGLSFK